MKHLIDIKLPEEVQEKLQSADGSFFSLLNEHLDKVITSFEGAFKARTSSGPLTRFERAILKDFLIEAVLPDGMRKLKKSSGSYPAIPEQEMAAK